APMAIPTSARAKAGASLTPSPTMATTSPRLFSSATFASLSSGTWQRGLESILRDPAPCGRNHDDWYDRVVPQINPDIIVLSEQGYDQPGIPLFIKRPSGEKLRLSSPAGEKVLSAISAQSISELRNSDRKIVLVGSIPLPDGDAFNPLNCLSTGEHHCDFRVHAPRTGLDHFFAAAAIQPNTFSLDLDRFVCPRLPVCDPVVNDIIVRRDYIHLTATYARALAPSVSALMHAKGILPARIRPQQQATVPARSPQ
ncbi:MAG: hypothetical protein QOG75_4629, partial [Mycobacterium sp.]|nr:hypothetical protein [Mycobacterium sp.]